MKPKKSRLESLGVSSEYDPSTPLCVEYTLTPPGRGSLTSPKSARAHATRVIEEVILDARKQGCNFQSGRDDALGVMVPDEDYLDLLLEQASVLYAEAADQRYQREMISLRPKALRVFNYATMGVGALAGVAVGYEQGSEWATHVASAMNDFTPYIAPITGLVQTGISLGACAVAGGAGMFLGRAAGEGMSYFPLRWMTSKAGKVGEYGAMKRVLEAELKHQEGS